MERLTALDASFLDMETDEIRSNVAWFSVFEGPAPDHNELVGYVESKLALVPRYRQKLHFLPLGVARPLWIDDAKFDVDFHIRRTALPAPGGEEQLTKLFARVVSQHLDRNHPLWEMWVVEGLSDHRWAVLWKLHHAMVDGVTANEINTVILSDEPTAPPPGEAGLWQPDTSPGPWTLATEALRGLGAIDQLRTLEGALRTPRDLLERGVMAVRSMFPLGKTLTEATTSSLNGPIGPHRRFSRTTVSLQVVKSIRAQYGGTVNDVVLAAVASGFRELLAARAELEPDSAVRTMVPVSVRAPGEQGGNQVSAVFVRLPLGEPDPGRRLRVISEQMDAVKGRGDAVAGQVLVGLQGFSPPMLLALGSRLAARLPQRTVNTVTTNVPGPQHPLYLLGRRMLEAGPYVMLGAQVRIATAIFSYDGNLYLGVSGDYDTVPDIEVMCTGIDRGFAELSGAGAQSAPDASMAGSGDGAADVSGSGGT